MKDRWWFLVDTGGGPVKLGEGVKVAHVMMNLEGHMVTVEPTASEQLIYNDDETNVIISGTGFNTIGNTLRFANGILGEFKTLFIFLLWLDLNVMLFTHQLQKSYESTEPDGWEPRKLSCFSPFILARKSFTRMSPIILFKEIKWFFA